MNSGPLNGEEMRPVCAVDHVCEMLIILMARKRPLLICMPLRWDGNDLRIHVRTMLAGSLFTVHCSGAKIFDLTTMQVCRACERVFK